MFADTNARSGWHVLSRGTRAAGRRRAWKHDKHALRLKLGNVPPSLSLFIVVIATAIAVSAIAPQASAGDATLPQQSVEHWMKQLAGADFRDRWHAGYMLGTLGPAAAPALSMLHKVLEKKSEHEYVRGMAAWAIGRIGPAPRARSRC